ncbi:major facilitator superfamily domain-containing protein [Spinellus fusiger]|nr:major facilitator superfamily domain-containing protein [Spinellus fusiger]
MDTEEKVVDTNTTSFLQQHAENPPSHEVVRISQQICVDKISLSGSCATVVEEPVLKCRTYPQAWLALFILVLLRTSVSVFQYTYSVVPNLTAEYFGVSLTAVNWLANVQGVVYVILSFFTGWLFEHFGVKRAAIRSIAGTFPKPLFALAMIGQVIGSCAAPLSLNIMTMFASVWFTEDRRATAGMFVASNYGGILGMFLLPSLATNIGRIPLIVMVSAFMAAGVFLPVIFMPAKPPTPPSLIQEQDKPPFFQGLKMLKSNLNFWIIFLVHSINIGLSIAFGTLFMQILEPHGYTNIQAGQISAVAFFSGTLGCSVAGPVLDMTKQHLLFLRLITPMVLITDIGFIFIIRESSYAAILFITAMNQFFLSFLVPVVIEIGSETSYPVADATTNSILWQGGQIFGIIFVAAMDATRDTYGTPPNNLFKALIIQAISAGVLTVLAFCFHGKMARSEAISLELKRQNEEIVEKVEGMTRAGLLSAESVKYEAAIHVS